MRLKKTHMGDSLRRRAILVDSITECVTIALTYIKLLSFTTKEAARGHDVWRNQLPEPDQMTSMGYGL